MKKYEIAYRDYAEAKRAHQVQKWFILNPASEFVRSVKTTAYDQNNNIQWYCHIFKAQKVQSPAKQVKELFSLFPNHFRWNGIVFCEV